MVTKADHKHTDIQFNPIIYSDLSEGVTISRSFKTLDDISVIASEVASYYPLPDDALIGIYEIMVNAIEHGNLGITYEEKTNLVKTGKWTEEILNRIELPQNKTKRAILTLEIKQQYIKLSVQDAGEGFDWKKYIKNSVTGIECHGRGIALARIISFDEVSYNDKGNEAICFKQKP